MHGTGSAHGKFGELLQGALTKEDTHFLVTLPILRFSHATFYCSYLEKDETVFPFHKIKAKSLVNKIMQYFGLSCGWKLTIESQLEEGKGLGSSTADLIACARAMANAIGKDIPIKVLLQFLKEIEPSDGIMYEGIVCFYHRQVALHSQLGYLPNLVIAGMDEGGIVDTVKFNQQLRPYTQPEKSEYAVLFNEIIDAIKNRDVKKIGKISTRSAILYQSINPKKHLDYFIDVCNEASAPGIIVAHSGTYVGIILDKKNPDFFGQLNFVKKKMKEKCLNIEVFNTFAKANNYCLPIKCI